MYTLILRLNLDYVTLTYTEQTINTHKGVLQAKFKSPCESKIELLTIFDVGTSTFSSLKFENNTIVVIVYETYRKLRDY